MNYSFHSVQKLEGERLILTPLQFSELTETAEALVSATTWFSVTRNLNSVSAFVDYFTPILQRQAQGESLTLLARLKDTGEIVGMSNYQYPGPSFRRVEIGFTWIKDSRQRTFVNSEMKLLMLSHAFEEMKTHRVEFSIHPNNDKSNRAILRLGAKFEGLLRKWRYIGGIDDGNRNIYSILDEEWPEIKARLL